MESSPPSTLPTHDSCADPNDDIETWNNPSTNPNKPSITTSSNSDLTKLEAEAFLEPRDDRDIKPPDGGYGWVIVAASFCIQMIGIGIAGSFGVLYVELQEHFEVEAGVVAWVGAICIGLSFIAGPLGSIMAHALGNRLSCMIGGVVASVGLFVSAFSPNIYFLYLSYGVVTGVGISISYVPAVVILGFYFDKRLSAASGVAVAGIGCGGLILPPLIQLLIDTYTWRGTMMILSGINLNVLVCAALLRPLSHQRKEENTKLCDADLLKESAFIMFSIAEILWNIAGMLMHTVVLHHSTLQGIGREQAALLLSVIGITGILGRIVFVIVPLHWDKLTMMAVATYLSAIPIGLYFVLAEYWIYVVHCTVYGLCLGVQLAVLPVVAVDLFGVERLTSAYGYLILADGLGALAGPVLGGHLYDVTGDYTMSFVLGSVVSVVSGIFMTVIIIQRRCIKPQPSQGECAEMERVDITITKRV